MRRVDATARVLMHKMMADAYEHGRLVWKENRRRRAWTGQPESDEFPCGPSDGTEVMDWLVAEGLMFPDENEDSSDED
ncbi:hypothetical protein FB45DRAFT_1020327 [Roridomyces roridus]|uniref:Uncharacterized protein n=1 Tax=Roridomyces roridus TaxID=1738132 RepID=A0AAD7CGM3_9AGAR|nr:hypothetical protein FB45DRAFT_1020327 [Roridomyces roridus]